jgi:hypothetical protein
MRRVLPWGVLVLASLLLVWIMIPEQIKASAYRAVMAQLLIRPNICMESNWEREALGFGRFHVAATEEWNGDVLILYDATCSDAQGQPEQVIGYEVFRPTPSRWVSLGGGYGLGTSGAHPVAYHFGFQDAIDQNGQPVSYSLVYGRILDPAVHRVEAVFSDGIVVQETPASSVFRLLVAHASMACTLRVLDVQGNVIEAFTLWEGTAPRA